MTRGVSYDEYGRTTGTVLKSNADASFATMSSSTAYANGLMDHVTDNTGATTYYGYDTKRRQNNVRDAAGVLTTTDYDERWERPMSVYQSGVVSLGYTYTDGNLTKLARGGYLPDTTTGKKTQEYHFSYDSFGNMTGVAAGGYKLAEYLYNAGNGTLKQMNYGTSGALGTISYTYDDLDRVVQAVYSDGNGSVTYGYLYSSDGNLSGITENGELLYTYDYDTLGRLIHSSALKDGDVVLYTAHKYDTSDRILSQTWQIGDDGFSERYIYNQNDGTLDTMQVQDDIFNFGYDALKRLSSRSLVLPGNKDLVTVDYAYKAGPSTNTTTTQIQSITYRVPETTTAIIPKLTYTYDVMGNITKVQPYGETATTYTYGKQNQLLSETKGNSKDTYTYDTYGNIRTIQKNESGYTSSYTEMLY